MPARSLAGAVHDHLEPLNSAIGCITQVPLAFQERRAASRFRADQLYTVAINNLRPVGLAGSQDVSITVGHRFRIRKASEHSDDFEAETASYFYSLLTPLEVEILTFQWTPAATTSKTFPHLHVGRAIVSDKTLIMPERFHKVHVPTGHVRACLKSSYRVD